MRVQQKISSFFILSTLLLFVSCDEQTSILKEYARFHHVRVSIPEMMLKIEEGVVEEVSYMRSGKPLLVRYYAPNECSDCALNHMKDNIRYSNLSQSEGEFDFIVIMAPPEEDRPNVIEKARAMHSSLAIYIDVSFHLQSLDVIPDYLGLHTFLLDVDGRPIFVGNPLQNKSTMSRFHRRIHN